MGPVRITIRCSRIEFRVVGNVLAARDQRFQRRMAAGFDFDDVVVSQLRLHILPMHRHFGKTGDDIKVCNDVGSVQESAGRGGDLAKHTPVDICLQLARAHPQH